MGKWDTILSIALLGTHRAPMPKESLWPAPSVVATSSKRDAGDASSHEMRGGVRAGPNDSTARSRASDSPARDPLPADSPARILLRAAAANYLWDVAGRRASMDATLTSEPAPLVDSGGTAEQIPTIGSEGISGQFPPAGSGGIDEQISPARSGGVSGQAPRVDSSGVGAPSSLVSAGWVSEAAAWRLGRMLNGEYRELAPEWFALAARRNVRVPRHWLPVVLDALKAGERSQFSAVLGPNALWLAKLNPAWVLHDLSAEPSEERWINGTLEERRAELSVLRAVDPARARAWIQSTWQTDPPNAREEFIRTLLVGLSHDDEPLLESALDDKRKGVRAAAGECLARLPQSAHARRNYARLQELFELRSKPADLLAKLGSPRLEVRLPSSLDKADIRDGLELNPPAERKIGERTYWLEQIVSIAPPAYWTERCGCAPQTFIDAVLATEYADHLLLALSQAAVRYQDIAWITALSNAWLERSMEPNDTVPAQTEVLIDLIAAASHGEREDLLNRLLDALSPAHFTLAYTLLTTANFPWSPALTRRAFALLGQRIAGESQQWPHPKNTLLGWGRHADLECACAAIADMLARSVDKSPWRNALEALADLIEFRAALKQELSI